MSKIILFGVFGLATFGIAAAASWWLQAGQTSETVAESQPADAQHEPPAHGADEAGSVPAGELPVAIRPKPLSVEEIYRLGENLRKREETLKARAEELDAERAHMKLAMEDIRREQQEFESLQTKVQGLIATAEQLVAELGAKRQQAAEEQKKAEQDLKAIKEAQTKAEQDLKTLKEAQGATNETERENIKRMAAWFQQMEPETAAEYLRELANDGGLDTAAQLLSDLEERDAAEILTAMSDAKLVIQLTEHFKDLKRPKKTTVR
jgi:flagellar motility protein MotE (MotC chaperone)